MAAVALPLTFVTALAMLGAVEASFPGYLGERTVKTTDGPIVVSMEEYVSDPETGKKFKIMVGMKIPYAAPPLPPLRFMPPANVTAWTEPRNCDRSKLKHMPACHQVKDFDFYKAKSTAIQTFWGEFMGGGGGISATETSEDCLYLNVWTTVQDDGTPYPAGAKGVLFFIHGGEFQFDTAFNNLYEGTSLAFMTQAVVVTFNYRLGPFGFLHEGSKPGELQGNAGLRDAAKALEWVHHNIEQFGGNKDSVTLYGGCASGGAVVQYLMTSPMVPNYWYKDGIMSSGVVGSHLSYQRPEIAIKNAEKLSKEVADLKNASATSILNYAKKLLDYSSTMEGKYRFMPTSDDEFFPYTPKTALHKLAKESKSEAKPVFLGFNRNEGSLTVAEHEMVLDDALPKDALGSMLFTKGVQMVAPETHTPGVLDLVKREYSYAQVNHLINFITDYWYKCDILDAINELEKSGNRRVFKYRFDAFLDIAQKAYPYFQAGHGLDMFMIWGRPFENELYSTKEEELSYAYAQIGLNFHEGTNASWAKVYSPKGSILCIDKKIPDYKKVVKIPENKCHFIHCLPPLQDYYKNGNMPDESCRKYLPKEPETAAATTPEESVALVLITVLATWMRLM